MAYYSLHAYDADVWVQEFRGINQADAEINADPRYAVEAMNVETPLGVLQPHAGYEIVDGEFSGNKIETLVRFYRRWTNDKSKEWLIAAIGGKLYCRPSDLSTPWKEIPMPDGITSFQSNVWSCVTYEINPGDEPNTIDVLLMSNAKDGMIMVIPPDRRATWGDLKTKTWNDLKTQTWGELGNEIWEIEVVDTRSDPEDDTEEPMKFGVIERHAERIWGTAMDDDPDALVYSAMYDPTDWTGAKSDDQPETSAGLIMQPSWDGDKFTALKTFGNQLLAFKGTRVWRVLGVGPHEYSFTEQFGGGTYYPNTLVVDIEQVLLADKEGISVYNGMSVSPFIRQQIQTLWRDANKGALDQMCAVMFKDKYYLAFPMNGSMSNNALLVYDKNEKSILLYKDIYAESLLATEDMLYATSATIPGKIVKINTDSWELGRTSGAPTKWVSPWMDFNRKSIQKGGYEVYFTPEVRGGPMTFKFTIQTEKKAKSKLVTVQDSTFKAKQRRIRFGGTGRRFRLIIETGKASPQTVWRLLGGIQMVVEIDPD